MCLATRRIEKLLGQCSSNSEKKFKCIKLQFQVKLTPKGSLSFNSNSEEAAIREVVPYLISSKYIFYLGFFLSGKAAF
jgi:hypothetical protein